MNEITTMIKYGGHAMIKPDLRDAFDRDIASLANGGMRIVITHGGGPQISELLERLAIESEFVRGLRVTGPEVMEVVEMALCGSVNKDVVRQLEKNGVPAVGISCQDGGLIIASQKSPELGRVGEVREVRPALIERLLENGYVPVVAPVAVDGKHEPINLNADTAAGALAGALAADYFVLVSDVPGVLGGNGELIAELDNEKILSLCQSGVIGGGMLPKIEACQNALRLGCKRAIILDGRQPNSLKRFLKDGEKLGTVIKG